MPLEKSKTSSSDVRGGGVINVGDSSARRLVRSRVPVSVPVSSVGGKTELGYRALSLDVDGSRFRTTRCCDEPLRRATAHRRHLNHLGRGPRACERSQRHATCSALRRTRHLGGVDHAVDGANLSFDGLELQLQVFALGARLLPARPQCRSR